MKVQQSEEIVALPLQSLFDEELYVDRGPDRRQAHHPGPPWLTDEGIVMEERRSNQDRRQEHQNH